MVLSNFPGAMEHWGMISYQESSMSFSEESNSAADKLSIAELIAHELAHFWFGDLVTCKWWDEIWLNEGMVFKRHPLFCLLTKIKC